MPLQPWGQLVREAGDQSDDFEVLPAADYDMEIIKAEAKQTSSGKVMFAIRCKVTSGPYQGRLVFANLTVSPENPTALGIFFRQMAAIGVSKEFFSNNPSDSQVAEALEGRAFRGQVAIRTWQGQERNEIKGYSRVAQTAAAGVPGPPMPPMVTPSPANAPSARSAPAPAAAPSKPPVAAAVAADKVAAAPVAAPDPVVQAPLPPVQDAPAAVDVPAVPAAPASPATAAEPATSLPAPADPF